MTKYVEWSEPWQYGDGPTEHVECIHRMKLEDAIKYQQGIYQQKFGHVYDNPNDAYYDFVDIRWAVIVEEK